MARKRKKSNTLRLLIEWILPLLVLFVVSLALISGYVAYQVVHPRPPLDVVDPSSFLLSFQEFRWQAEGGSELAGWLVAGRPGAPFILLCHGYGGNRGRSLSLAERLHAAGFSTAILDMRGHAAASDKGSTLGWREARDVQLAVEELRAQNLLGQQKLGAWGADIGGFAALASAAACGLRAVVVDTPYVSVRRYLEYRTVRFAGGDYGLLHRGVRLAFALMADGAAWPALPELVEIPKDVQVAVLVSEEEPGRAALAEEMVRSLAIQQVTRLPRTRVDDLTGPGLEAYDRQVTSFFQGVSW